MLLPERRISFLSHPETHEQIMEPGPQSTACIPVCCDPQFSTHHRPVELRAVERARAYLEARCTEPTRLSAVAEECGMSIFHLIRVFGRIVGVPPYAYLIQLRVNRAQAMLRQGIKVSDVAYRCGFSDQSHLTRAFRKAVGVPPGQFLRSVKPKAA